MFELWSLTKRHMIRYLKDKSAVFFSFLSVLILLALYIMFIGQSYKSGFINNLPRDPLTGAPINFPDALLTYLIISMTMGGVLVINTMSLSLGIMGTFVEDMSKRTIDAFLVTPVKRWKIIISYFLSAIIVTSVFSIIMWGLTIAYVGLYSGYWFSFSVIMRASGLLILYTLVSTSMMIFIMTFLKSINAFGALSGVLGTFVGFTSGIYIPLSQLPQGVQYVASINPFSHMSIVLKQVMMEESLNLSLPYFGGSAGYDQVVSGFGAAEIGVFGQSVSMFWIFLGIGVLSVVFLAIAFRNMNQKIKS